MRLARDGKKFDSDYLEAILPPDEVELIQFLRPNGRRRRMSAPVGEEYVKKAKNLILSVEDLGIGKIAIYGRKIGDDEENEITRLADNGPGLENPTKVLQDIIDELQN